MVRIQGYIKTWCKVEHLKYSCYVAMRKVKRQLGTDITHNWTNHVQTRHDKPRPQLYFIKINTWVHDVHKGLPTFKATHYTRVKRGDHWNSGSLKGWGQKLPLYTGSFGETTHNSPVQTGGHAIAWSCPWMRTKSAIYAARRNSRAVAAIIIWWRVSRIEIAHIGEFEKCTKGYSLYWR